MAYLGNQIQTQAFITDQFSGTGSQTQYTMSVAPAGTTSVLVSVSGVLQDPSSYSVNGTTLTFSAAPPYGVGNVSVRYLGVPASGIVNTAYRTVTEFTATAGQTSFSVPSYTVGFINVYRNGARLGSDDFTATSGTTVVLAAGATVGDLITTESFYVSSVLNAIPATAGAVNSTFLADNAVVAAKIADSSVTQNKIANGAVAQSKLASGVAGTGPAFSATGGSVSATSGVWTKMPFNTKGFDTNNNYDATTNYRFTPNVAGYYQVNISVQFYPAAGNAGFVTLYKNGANLGVVAANLALGSSIYPVVAASGLVYLNGSTDYIECYAYQASGSGLTVASNCFSACLARAA